MDWNNYREQYEIITGETINLSTVHNNIDDLTGYTLVTRNSISKLELGCHIKYIKNIYENNILCEKIYNGGILVDMIDRDKMYMLKLVLTKTKTNAKTCKLHFIRFKVYAKVNTGVHEYKITKLEDHFRKEHAHLIKEKKKEIEDRVQVKLKLNQSKYKNHYVRFN